MITQSFAGMIGTAILQISAPKQLLQIASPLSQNNIQINSPLLISAPISLLQITAPTQLLISEPEYNLSVFLTEYDKRCLKLLTLQLKNL
jgi:hypothetical protein